MPGVSAGAPASRGTRRVIDEMSFPGSRRPASEGVCKPAARLLSERVVCDSARKRLRSVSPRKKVVGAAVGKGASRAHRSGKMLIN